MNQFLIPANSKKSGLFFGLFTFTDLIIEIAGLLISLVALLALNNPSIFELIIAILPMLITSFLVFPVPNYHNVLQLLTNIFKYIFGRKRYYWKGWCVKDEFK